MLRPPEAQHGWAGGFWAALLLLLLLPLLLLLLLLLGGGRGSLRRRASLLLGWGGLLAGLRLLACALNAHAHTGALANTLATILALFW